MLVCFGAAWPFSIFRMLKTKRSTGKSLPFLWVILAGYVFGVLFQLSGERNAVIFLYFFNALLVMIDICLTLKYSRTIPNPVVA